MANFIAANPIVLKISGLPGTLDAASVALLEAKVEAAEEAQEGAEAAEESAQALATQTATIASSFNSSFQRLSRSGLFASSILTGILPLVFDAAGSIVVGIRLATGAILARFDGSDAGFKNAARQSIGTTTSSLFGTSQANTGFPFFDSTLR